MTQPRSLFDIRARQAPAASVGNVCNWEGRTFVLTLCIRCDWHLVGTQRVEAVDPNFEIAAATIWAKSDSTDLGLRDYPFHPLDSPAASEVITCKDAKLSGLPATDIYTAIAFVGANAAGRYWLLLDAYAAKLELSLKHHSEIRTIASLSVDEACVWSKTYAGRNPERFLDRHALTLL